MKILRLEIKNIRGIPDLSIELNGKSLVVYGPNGSGKSAVIDSLDFLLTGKMTRISGEGTDGISLKDYGPHIDKVGDLGAVMVVARIQIPGIPEPFTISRSMANPNTLDYPEKYSDVLSPILELLSRGQYVLTRREILKLITAKASTRAQQINQILNLSKLDAIRSVLVKVRNERKNSFDTSIRELKRAQQNLATYIGKLEYTEEEVLEFVNNERIKLGSSKIEKLSSNLIQEGITGILGDPLRINHKNLTQLLNSLKANHIEEITVGLSEVDKKLKELIIEIQNDPVATWNATRFAFTNEGLRLLRDSGECPLCDKDWPTGELKTYLQSRIDTQVSNQVGLLSNSKIISDLAKRILQIIQQVVRLIEPLIASESVKSNRGFVKGYEYLIAWGELLNALIDALDDPLLKYSDDSFPEELVDRMYLSEQSDEILEALEVVVKTLSPEATPEQTAWSNLMRLADMVRTTEELSLAVKNAAIIRHRATLIENSFIQARDEILNNLYVDIRQRFIEFYKEMHGEDEIGFDAEFTPKDAALNFKVDFYGRGLHPPHAMHSEGHQDSMGVCLFLALSEYLNQGFVDLVILDDVIMSVDNGHRRMFCNVLTKYLSDRQFIITTHDTTWANQLKSSGIVPSKQMLRFSNWNVELGPMVHYEADMWGRINKDIENDDVPSAAARLRRGMEEHSRFVCHNLRAFVPYSLEDSGTLGDFMPAAIGRYKELLGLAKAAANSWNRKDIIESLNRVEELAKEIVRRTNAEEWSINRAVHYNEWATFGKEEFILVIQAFRDLYEKVFSCPNEACQTVLKVTFDGPMINGVRCRCGEVNWNLTKK